MAGFWLLVGVGTAAAALLWTALSWRRARGRPVRERIAPEAIPPVDGDLTAALYTAARNGDSARALELLGAGANAHALPPADARDQRSLIALAAVLPDLALLRGLIARGLDPNQVHAGMNALIAATRDSWHGRPDAVLTLLSNGADPRTPDPDGNTPLHHAARSTDPSVAALLCDAGGEIEARNGEGVTPLGMACACGNWRLAKFLIGHGARTDTADAETSPALLSAAATDADDPAGVELLIKHKARVNSRDGRGRSALHEAALHGHAGIVRVLLAAGADVDPVDSEGYTPLLDAVRAGSLDTLDVLIAAKADPRRGDAHGRNALILACLADSPSLALVQRLLDLGVKADLADHTGKSAIDYALSAGRWAMVKRLDPAYPLPPSVGEAGANGGEQQPPAELLRTLLRSQTPISNECAALVPFLDADQLGGLLLDLDIAARPQALNWLLAQGVDPNQHDADGRTVLQRLLTRLPGTLPSVQILLQHETTRVSGRGILAQMLARCLRGRHTAAEFEQCALALIAGGADLGPAEHDHAPPVTLAIRLGWDQVVEHVARKGVDLNACDEHGLAALHLAAALGRETSVRLLLRHGAALDLRTRDGQDALGIALAAGHHALVQWLDWCGWQLPRRALLASDVPAAAAAGDTRAVQRLLDIGLALDALDEQGCTALIRAAGGGHLELLEHLIERGADLDHRAHSGATALSAAVNMGHDAIIACLLKAGANLEQRLPGGLTVLMLAAARGLPETCQQLLQAGADPNARTDKGRSVLHCAALYGFGAQDSALLQHLFTLVIAAGADCDAPDLDGLTPLLLLLGATAKPGSAGDESVIEAGLAQLLDAGARPDVQEQRHGLGPLHLAALHGLPRIARRLLHAGADPELRDAQGRLPRALAISRGFIDVAAVVSRRSLVGQIVNN